jgi:hypothetical protein
MRRCRRLSLFATRWIVLAWLAVSACASPPYSEVQADLPKLASGTGRIVFFGDNWGWYGIFAGVSWTPVITIDGRALDVGHGTDVYFVADVPTGRRIIAVDGQALLVVLVEGNATKYVEMERYEEANDDFNLRSVDYKMRLLHWDEARAKARLDGLEFIGVAE